jgi:hypothetical protein
LIKQLLFRKMKLMFRVLTSTGTTNSTEWQSCVCVILVIVLFVVATVGVVFVMHAYSVFLYLNFCKFVAKNDMIAT